MKSFEFKVFAEAQRIAEGQLSFFSEMMASKDKKITKKKAQQCKSAKRQTKAKGAELAAR